MMRTTQDPTRDEDVAAAGRRSRAHGAMHGSERGPVHGRSSMHGRGSVRGRGGRRMVAPLAGIALAAALVAGCGGTDPQEAGDDPAAEEPAEDPGAEDDDAAGDDADEGSEGEGSEGEDPDDGADDAADDADDQDGGGDGDGAGDDAADDEGEGEDGSTGDGGSSEGENLFEGTWGLGHDSKVLSAEELSVLLEEEAAARGPEEMSLSVECGDGIDSGAGDLDAECIAYADEGVEHLWLITAGPADAGLEIEVENAG